MPSLGVALPQDSVLYFPFLMNFNYINPNPSEFNLSFRAINCNSLNLAASGSFQQKLKIYGIVKLRTDVIFLSDIRLSSRQGVKDLKGLEDAFRVNPYCSYKCFFNSSRNKRGVGILLKHLSLFQK
jgi:hypothetical protein